MIDSLRIIQYKFFMLKRLLLIYLAASLALSACSALPLPFFATPTPTVTPSPTATATLRPTATPTATPTPLPVVRLELGEQALLAGDYDKAKREYQTAQAGAQDDETRAAAQTGLGRVELLSADPLTAITILNGVVARYPLTQAAAPAYYFIGRAYEVQNNLSKAVEAYAQYLKLKPGVLQAYIENKRGDLLQVMGEYSQALAAYQNAAQAAQLTPATAIELKVGRMYARVGDVKNALRTYLAVYDSTQNEYYRAQANFLAGQAYISMGEYQQAFARYQDSINNYPRAYDSYSGLVALVNAGVAVDELSRGMTNYYAGQYGYAIEAFNRYLARTPNHDGQAHHFKALSLQMLERPQEAIAEWDALIRDHGKDRFWAAAWDEKAYTQWTQLNQYSEASRTLLEFVRRSPQSPEAPSYLFEAARILERNNKLVEAAPIWERTMTEYPASEWGFRSLLLAGVTYYRIPDYPKALTVFQRAAALSAEPGEQSAAYLWIGKVQQAQGDTISARTSLEVAAQRDPTGYYSERAAEMLQGMLPFTSLQAFKPQAISSDERRLAEGWLRITFNFPAETDLGSLGDLAQDARIARGNAFWELGLYAEGRNEFEAVREEIVKDAARSFRLMNHMVKIGCYRTAILLSREILNLAGIDAAGTAMAPTYLNHVRFGLFFREDIVAAAQAEKFNPYLLYSVIRQESLFEGFAYSSAGARGLMQIMPATGAEIARQMAWPPNYDEANLLRPVINLRMGARYLARQRDGFGGDLFAALAAYNGGPGNAQAWRELSGGDPDLFLEVIRIKETRDYVMRIYENAWLYQKVYGTLKP